MSDGEPASDLVEEARRWLRPKWQQILGKWLFTVCGDFNKFTRTAEASDRGSRVSLIVSPRMLTRRDVRH